MSGTNAFKVRVVGWYLFRNGCCCVCWYCLLQSPLFVEWMDFPPAKSRVYAVPSQTEREVFAESSAVCLANLQTFV